MGAAVGLWGYRVTLLSNSTITLLSNPVSYADLTLKVLLSSKITLLSNTTVTTKRIYLVLLPSKITLLSNLKFKKTPLHARAISDPLYYTSNHPKMQARSPQITHKSLSIIILFSPLSFLCTQFSIQSNFIFRIITLWKKSSA